MAEPVVGVLEPEGATAEVVDEEDPSRGRAPVAALLAVLADLSEATDAGAALLADVAVGLAVTFAVPGFVDAGFGAAGLDAALAALDDDAPEAAGLAAGDGVVWATWRAGSAAASATTGSE